MLARETIRIAWLRFPLQRNATSIADETILKHCVLVENSTSGLALDADRVVRIVVLLGVSPAEIFVTADAKNSRIRTAYAILALVSYARYWSPATHIGASASL